MRPPVLRLHADEMIVEMPPRDRGRFVAGRNYGPGTQFERGHTRGIATRYQTGRASENRLPLGSVRIRIETRSGLPRAWIKVAEPNVWAKRALVVWEAANGRLPIGMVVHHKDRDGLNDVVNNLIALTRKEHAAEHQRELVTAAAARLGLRVVEEDSP